jgi:tRNA(fMet)-specific endonuclease VapC
MTRLLFDTTFLVDADRTGDVLDEVIEDDDDVAIAAITVAELQVGVLLSHAGKRRSARQRFLDDVLATVPVLDYDLAVAAAHAELLADVRRRGVPRGAHDLVIAATAQSSRRIVVTADIAAFDDLPDVETRTYR